MAETSGPYLDLIARGTMGALVTLKRDGRPQLSNVVYAYDAGRWLVRVSVTDGRAKTRNLRRDPRASLYVTSDGGWKYAVAEGEAELTSVATDPHDEAAEELVDLYRTLSGEHPDWAEFRAAMVEQERLVLRMWVTRAYGMLTPPQ